MHVGGRVYCSATYLTRSSLRCIWHRCALECVCKFCLWVEIWPRPRVDTSIKCVNPSCTSMLLMSVIVFVYPSGASLYRWKLCSSLALLPKSVQRRSFCASSSYYQPRFGAYICRAPNNTVACTLKVDKTKNYCDSRRQE